MTGYTDYQQVMTSLRQSYNQEQAEQRDLREQEGWKKALRQQFLSLLHQENKTTLLEIGAGTGHDSLFFQNNGLDVVCTDLSAAMVNRCRAKGLTAYVMDFLGLDFPPKSFDAVYALNCLHHVPTHDLPSVLQRLWSLLRPSGLFSLCVYGGREWEGVREHDWHQPPRFFAYHTDTFMQHITAPLFDLVSFHTLPSEEHPLYFQCLTLRAKQAMEGTQAGDALALSVRKAQWGGGSEMSTVSVDTLRTWLEATNHSPSARPTGFWLVYVQPEAKCERQCSIICTHHKRSYDILFSSEIQTSRAGVSRQQRKETL